MTIILTGFMCSGKTSVANALGKMLESEVVDLDSLISTVMGQTPKQIISGKGEEAFRELETTVLREVLQERPGVIALGGGAWIVARNRELIKTHGAKTIWLDVPFEVCWARIREGGDCRPLATSELKSRSLYDRRYSTYQLADIRIAVGASEPIEAIANTIARLTATHETTNKPSS
jgi:shikimate kinase